MKIIKEGNLNKPIVFECTRCGCIFEAEMDEYFIYKFSPYCVRAETHCPHCQTLTIKWIKE